MPEMNAMIRLFKALSDRTRLRIVRLMATNEAEMCVCELVDSLEVPQYHVSRHLKEMRDAGLVTTERDGRWVYYRLEDGAVIKEIARIVAATEDAAFGPDQKNFEERMALREDGRCRVGILKAHLMDSSAGGSARKAVAQGRGSRSR